MSVAAQFEHPRTQAAQEGTVVGDENHRAFVAAQGIH